MTPPNYKEIHNKLNSIQDDLNSLGNNKNVQKHVQLYTRFYKERVAWGKIRRELTITRSRRPIVNSVNSKFRRVYLDLKLKFPELSMQTYMRHTQLYKNHPNSQSEHKRLNNKYTKIVTWEPYYVNNLPVDALTRNVINNKNKAIKINKSIYSQQSFRNLARTPIMNVLSYHGNSIIFIDPLTRKTVRRSQVEPVTIHKKNI